MSVAIAPSSLHLHPDDNIAVATRPLPKGTALEIDSLAAEVVTREAIDMGHKVAVRAIAKGEPIRKFGQTIGFATCPIQPGQWVHTQNVEAGQLSLDYAFSSEVPPDPAPIRGRTFQGFRRADG